MKMPFFFKLCFVLSAPGKPAAAVPPGKENPAGLVTPVAVTPGSSSGTTDISENGESTLAVVKINQHLLHFIYFY